MKTALIIYHRIDFDGLCSLSIICDWCESHGIQFKKLGYYWSSSVFNKSYTYGVLFYSGYLNPQDYYDRCYGFSVRLAREHL